MGCTTYYEGPKSDHFDGSKFFMTPTVDKSFSDLIKWKWFGHKEKWPENIPVEQKTILKDRLGSGELSITFINHATFLIQLGKLNILTDPIYTERASPVSFAGPRRVRKPGVKFEDLPRVDVVIISHNHYDHFDNETIKMLLKRDNPLFLVGLGNDALLKDLGVKKFKALDWRERTRVNGIEFTFLKCQHWSARGIFDRNKMLWGSFALSDGNRKIYFAGDTGYGKFLKELGERFDGFDVSLLPIGAYEPRWFMKTQHMNPEEAVQAHLDLRSKFSIGMHFGTFQLTDEGVYQPLEDLKISKEKQRVTNFIVPEFGETITF